MKGKFSQATHQANRKTEVPAVAARVEVTAIEVQAVRVVAKVVRRGPVVAAGTDTDDRSPKPVARSGQEHSAINLEGTLPYRTMYHIRGKVGLAPPQPVQLL